MSSTRLASAGGPGVAAVGLHPAPQGAQAQRLTSPAGGTIRYVHWRAQRPPAAGVALVLPGLGEFVEKYHETVADLLARGFEVFVLDWFGQGLSTRALANRGKVHLQDLQRYLVDLGRLVDSALPPRDGSRPRVVFCHSLGAHLALRYLHDHPRAFDALVMTSPMIDINYGALPRWLARFIAEAMCSLGFSRAYVFGAGDYSQRRVRFQGNRLTQDRGQFLEQHAWIARNPELAIGGPTFGWLRAAQRSIALTLKPAFAPAIRVPVLMLSAQVDRIVAIEATRRFAQGLDNAQQVEFSDAGHELLRERDALRQLLWQRIDDFLAAQFPVSQPSPSARTGS